MALNNEFALQSIAAYRGDLRLGYRHSLDECDFYDSFRCFPENALDFYKLNGVGVNYFWKSFDGVYSKKNSELIASLKETINGKGRGFSDVDLRDVKASYLVDNCHGIVFLDASNLSYYLLAIIFRCCSGEMRELNLALDFMLSNLLGIAKEASLRGGEVPVDKEIIPVVSRFLREVYEVSPDEYYDAKKALDIYWGKLAGS